MKAPSLTGAAPFIVLVASIIVSVGFLETGFIYARAPSFLLLWNLRRGEL